jgi:hypothetical protein
MEVDGMVARASAVVIDVDFVVVVGVVVVAPILASEEASSIVGLFIVPYTLSVEDMCQRRI